MVHWYTMEKVEKGFLLIKHEHVGKAKTRQEANALLLKLKGVKAQ